MKLLALLCLLEATSAVATTTGSPPPDGFRKVRRDVSVPDAPREKPSAVSASKELPTDLIQMAADYDFRNFIPHWGLSVDVLLKPANAGLFGYGLYALGRDCVSYKEDGEEDDKHDCISGSIMVFVGVINLYRDKQFFIEQAQNLRVARLRATTELFRNAGILEFFNSAANPQAPGPFVPTPNTEEIEMGAIEERRSLLEARTAEVLADAEGALSAQLGHEVRSIGFWDGSMPGEPARRGEEREHVPVFAMRRGNQDFHVAVTRDPGGNDAAEPVANRTRVRIGLGPGPETELNKRRLLKARDMEDFEVEDVDLVEEFGFNEVYFDRGGLEGFGEAEFDPDNEDDHPTTYEEMEWLRAILECSLNPKLREQDPPGMWWSIVDHDRRMTVATGSVAAFYPGYPSVLEYMGRGTHLTEDERCMVNEDWFD